MTERATSDRTREGVSREATGLVRGSGLNLLGALCSQSASLVLISTLAVQLGQEAVGRYAECYALLSLLGLLSLAGLRNGLTRFTAIYLADDNPAGVRGTIRSGLALTLAVSTGIAAILALSAGSVADLMNDPALRLPVLLVALTLPASAFEDVALAATQGWRSQKAFALIGLIADPTSRLVLTVAALMLGAGLNGAMWALVASSWIGAVLAALSLRRRLRQVPKAAPVVELRRVLSFSGISWVSALATTGLVWADTLLIGALSTQADVGRYTIATRLVTLAVFVMAPINAAFTPQIAHFSHIGDIAAVSKSYGAANRWIMRLSMPAFIMLLIFPGDLLGFFGPGFSTAEAAAVTMILAVGQMVSAAAGPCGGVLNMSGRVSLSMVDNLAAVMANVALNFWLVPRYGIVGAAVAWSSTLIVTNLVKAVQVRVLLGVRSTESDWTKTFLAAAPAGAAGLIVAWLTSGWLAAASFGLGSITITFVVTLVVVGLGVDDAAIVRSIVDRARRGTRRVTAGR